ncbi:MAG: hypothetical protein Q7J15_09150 [Candidatus Desulfaltia sp.]|nr:hypothetical protein [Candidatus Desulfaltia sp.]
MNLSPQHTNDIKQWIPLEQCKDNHLYRIAARNSTLGIWRSQKQGFEIRRDKLGSVYRFLEFHWDWQGGEILFGKKMLGTAKPLMEIEQAPAFKSEKEFIEYMERKFEELQKD